LLENVTFVYTLLTPRPPRLPGTASGKAKDNVGVSNVWVQFNGAGWNAATSSNEYSNWTAAGPALLTGGNLVQAYAVDAAGNVFLTNTVKFN